MPSIRRDRSCGAPQQSHNSRSSRPDSKVLRMADEPRPSENEGESTGQDGLPQALPSSQKDILMADAPPEQASVSNIYQQAALVQKGWQAHLLTQSKSPAAGGHAPSPAPPRTGTPAQGSRAASVHPDPIVGMPAEAAPHGDPTRRYLNTKVTGVLLEGMKQLAKDKCVDSSIVQRQSSCWHLANRFADQTTHCGCWASSCCKSQENWKGPAD